MLFLQVTLASIVVMVVSAIMLWRWVKKNNPHI